MKVNIPVQVGKSAFHCPVSKQSISSRPSSTKLFLHWNCNLCPVFTVWSPGCSPVTMRWWCIMWTLQVMSGMNKTDIIKWKTLRFNGLGLGSRSHFDYFLHALLLYFLPSQEGNGVFQFPSLPHITIELPFRYLPGLLQLNVRKRSGSMASPFSGTPLTVSHSSAGGGSQVKAV